MNKHQEALNEMYAVLNDSERWHEKKSLLQELIDKNGKMSFEQTNELYEFLRGNKYPQNWRHQQELNLSDEQAFRIIYFLQEELFVIPDNFENCAYCGDLFDTQHEGYVSENKPYKLCEWHAVHHPDWSDENE